MKLVPLLICGVLFSSRLVTMGAFNFFEDYNDNAVDANFAFTSDAGFSHSLTNGALVLKKSAGTGDGRVSMDSTFFLTGDFVAVIDVPLRPSSAGISFVFMVRDAQSSLADVYFRSSDLNNKELWGIIFKPTITQTFINNTATTATFRIRRVGNVLFTEYNTGGGFTVLQTKTNSVLAVPVTVGVRFIQEFSNTSIGLGIFDNLSIVSDGVTNFIPPLLSITKSNANAIVSWPGTALDFVLESAESFSLPVTWNMVTNPVTLINGQNRIGISPTNDVFFRLRK